MGDILLKAEHMVKEFGATKAVTDVSITLCRGEVCGLIGENGSGKSTLSNMIAGVYEPTGGSMYFKGQKYCPQTILESKKAGIVLLTQELGTINELTVAENMFIGEESRFSGIGSVKSGRLNAETDKILKKQGIEGINPSAQISSYSFEERKMIEVARALNEEPEILIVDETTTALSQKSRDKIYEIIEKQKKDGKCVIFISHNLDEIQNVCDKVVVLRDGQYISTLENDEITPDNMRQLMIGRDLSGHYYRTDKECNYDDDVVLRVNSVSLDNVFRNISIELHKGEILGIGGLTECGMHELLKVIYGAVKPTEGNVTVCSGNVNIKNTAVAVDCKIAYLPKDRDQESLFQSTSIKDNIVAASSKKLQKGCFILPKSEKRLAEKKSAELSIKMQNINQNVRELSGGNKQKVVVAKWLANDSEILLMDCPTRGIDIGVKANIYNLMEQLKADGKAIIMVSEEMEELIGMSDRILIMKDGELTGEFTRSQQLTEQMIIEKMI